jgi:hypothetical protein
MNTFRKAALLCALCLVPATAVRAQIASAKASPTPDVTKSASATPAAPAKTTKDAAKTDATAAAAKPAVKGMPPLPPEKSRTHHALREAAHD